MTILRGRKIQVNLINIVDYLCFSLRVPKLRKLKIAESSPLAVHCCLYDCFPPKKPVWENDVINYFISCM